MAQYHMRRPELENADDGEMKEILRRGKCATIALCRDREPYVVTLSYGFDEAGKALYFHCATQGLKLEFVRARTHGHAQT